MVLNKENGFSRTDLTGGDGAFTFPALPVGTYRLTAEKPGFSTYVQEGITLTVNQTATQRITLQVGTATQEVTVVENAAMVNTQTATIGQLVNQKQVTELPLNGRGAQGLVLIAVGTADNTSVSGILGQGGIYGGNLYSSEQMAGVNGGGTGNVNYQMDGSSHNDTYVNMNLPFPNPDALQEFNLQTSSMSAQYGGGAAVVNIVTKSGTNSLHGSAFEFVRNGDMNARNFFAAAQDTLKRNQYGATIGGPIKKDQLFFFGTYQGTRIRTTPAGVIAFVPTVAERNGDFTGSAQLVDPTTRAPIPGNKIPLSQFSGPSKYFLQDSSAQRPGRAGDVPGSRLPAERRPVHAEGRLGSRQTSDQRTVFLHQVRFASGFRRGQAEPAGDGQERQPGANSNAGFGSRLFGIADAAVPDLVWL